MGPLLNRRMLSLWGVNPYLQHIFSLNPCSEKAETRNLIEMNSNWNSSDMGREDFIFRACVAIEAIETRRDSCDVNRAFDRKEKDLCQIKGAIDHRKDGREEGC